MGLGGVGQKSRARAGEGAGEAEAMRGPAAALTAAFFVTLTSG